MKNSETTAYCSSFASCRVTILSSLRSPALKALNNFVITCHLVSPTKEDFNSLFQVFALILFFFCAALQLTKCLEQVMNFKCYWNKDEFYPSCFFIIVIIFFTKYRLHIFRRLGSTISTQHSWLTIVTFDSIGMNNKFCLGLMIKRIQWMNIMQYFTICLDC